MRTSTVWMVHARTGVAGRKGLLSLEGTSVVFRPESGSFGDSILPLSSVKKVRRVRGSPVLEIHLALEEHPPVVGFYFVRPPDLNPPVDGRLRLFPKRTARKDAMTLLWQGYERKKNEIAAWVRALERARAG